MRHGLHRSGVIALDVVLERDARGNDTAVIGEGLATGGLYRLACRIDIGDRVVYDIDAVLFQTVVGYPDGLHLAVTGQDLVAQEAGVIRLVGLDQGDLDRRIRHADVLGSGTATDTAADHDDLLAGRTDNRGEAQCADSSDATGSLDEFSTCEICHC